MKTIKLKIKSREWFEENCVVCHYGDYGYYIPKEYKKYDISEDSEIIVPYLSDTEVIGKSYDVDFIKMVDSILGNTYLIIKNGIKYKIPVWGIDYICEKDKHPEEFV